MAELMMRNHPFILVGWMFATMVIVGGAITQGWSLWFVGLLGGLLLSLAYMIARKSLSQTSEDEKTVRRSLKELQQALHDGERQPSVPFPSQSLVSVVRESVVYIKERMRALEEDRVNMAAIVENLMEGVVAFDFQGQVLFSNASACVILGLDRSQLQGRSVWEVMRIKELAELVEECRDLPLHERHRVEVDIHAPARMIVEVYGLAFPLANQKNGSVMVLHDVTQLRHLEQVRTEFIDNVSHELRTPLAAIIGYLETLMDEPSLETPNNRKFVHVAHQHAERLNRLVDDLRSLAEIESGKVLVRWDAVELTSLVDEVSEMLQPHVKKKYLDFKNQIGVEVIVWTDRDRMIQILLNLIDNAIKYSSEGGSIIFRAERLEQSVVLQVKDTGQGIPSTDLPRITERFYRVDRARSREEGGTGLGLSIVKHLVQLLNGQLRIQSELGKGTTVEVELPSSKA